MKHLSLNTKSVQDNSYFIIKKNQFFKVLTTSVKYVYLEQIHLLNCLSIVTVTPQVRSALMSPKIEDTVGVTPAEIVK